MYTASGIFGKQLKWFSKLISEFLIFSIKQPYAFSIAGIWLFRIYCDFGEAHSGNYNGYVVPTFDMFATPLPKCISSLPDLLQ